MRCEARAVIGRRGSGGRSEAPGEDAEMEEFD